LAYIILDFTKSGPCLTPIWAVAEAVTFREPYSTAMATKEITMALFDPRKYDIRDWPGVSTMDSKVEKDA